MRDLLKQIGELTHSDVTLGTGEGTATVVRAIEIRLAVERDEVEERSRLERELQEATQTLQRSRELLAKPGFSDRAPKDIVEKERARLREREERVKLLADELRRRR